MSRFFFRFGIYVLPFFGRAFFVLSSLDVFMANLAGEQHYYLSLANIYFRLCDSIRIFLVIKSTLK